jgi:arginine-tRNA-protein transferase
MQPQEIIVFDEPRPCSYLPGRIARLPYRHPITMLTPEVFDRRLAEGDRRSGIYLYRVKCPWCQACQPIRLDVGCFQPDATQRRMQRRGADLLETRIGPPRSDTQRIALYNRHLFGRGLNRDEDPISQSDYQQFLTQTCCQTIEFSYWNADRLVAVAIGDLGQTSLSAVYCYFDPDFKGVSLGTYSVLRQVEFCRQTGRRYLYLGFYIAESPHMKYKAQYRPHQRLIDGQWINFDSR